MSVKKPRRCDTLDNVLPGEVAITLDGYNLIVSREDADAMAAQGVEFAYLHTIIRGDGRRVMVTVPVNGRG